MHFDKKESIEALRLMYLCRFFEDKIESLFSLGLIHGTTHLSTGQEAAEVGLCMALDREDWILPTHRCHGFTIAKSLGDKEILFKAFSEMLGSRHGLAKGLGGSMHMPDKEHCNMGSSAVVASGVPIATGIAFYLKQTASKNISVAIFGDGASSRGSVHESMNLASVWNLPVLFFLENNLYGMSAKSTDMISTERLSSRGQAYSMQSKTIDGNKLEEVYTAVQEAARYIRETSKPYLLEVLTYRQKGHSKNDKRVYRSAEEEENWLKKDPILLFKEDLLACNILSKEEIADIEKSARNTISEEAERAIQHKNEVLSMEEAENLVYVPERKDSNPNISQSMVQEPECGAFNQKSSESKAEASE